MGMIRSHHGIMNIVRLGVQHDMRLVFPHPHPLLGRIGLVQQRLVRSMSFWSS